MKKKILNIASWSILLIILDQITKYFVHQYLQNPINILGNFFRLEYSQNTGIAFGMPIPYQTLILGNLVLICLIIYLIFKEFNLEQPIGKIGLILIISGAFGNLIDRIFRGFVVDFIAIGRWPNFNLADAYISIGILLMILFYGRIRREASEKNKKF